MLGARSGLPLAAVGYEDIIETVGMVVDFAGVVVIVLGIAWATRTLVPAGGRGGIDRYRTFRQEIGRAILLGLELLVAGDIIRTVAVSPTFTSVGVLAAIVAVRTFLSFTLEAELTGRWPWQRRLDDRGQDIRP
jgi:uncharacterized membrane protein